MPTVVFLLLFGVVLSGCRQHEADPLRPLLDDAAFAKARGEQEAEFRRFAGGRLRYHPELRTVAYADSMNVQFSKTYTPGTSLIRFLVRYPSLFGSVRTDQFHAAEPVTESSGLQHVSLRQSEQGVSLWGCGVFGHVSADRKLLRLFARTVPLQAYFVEPKTPLYDAEEARQHVLRLLFAELPRASWSTQTPKLYYLPTVTLQTEAVPAEKRLALVYRVEVSGQDADRPLHEALFVSAHDLTVRAREELVVAADLPTPAVGSGTDVFGQKHELSITQRGDTYTLEDLRRGSNRATSAKSGERLPGKTVQSNRPDTWESPHAVSVYVHLSHLWDYFAAEHQRFGWDGFGRGLLVVMSDGFTASSHAVALFDGQRLLFGVGQPPTLLPAGGAFDVVAHEYAHALIRSTANLAAEGESGALDEGLANLLACLVEQQTQGPQANWTIGEQVYRPTQGAAALSDLQDPARTDQARLVSDRPTWEHDLARAPAEFQRSLRRFRAGYVGHAGFQISKRLGTEKTVRLLLRALNLYLHRYADVFDWADAMQAAACDLYPEETDTPKKIRDAFATVGIQLAE